MKVKVLTLRWDDETGGLDERELEAFMEGRAVLEVAEHFFIHDSQPTLVLTLSYRDEAPCLCTTSDYPDSSSLRA